MTPQSATFKLVFQCAGVADSKPLLRDSVSANWRWNQLLDNVGSAAGTGSPENVKAWKLERRRLQRLRKRQRVKRRKPPALIVDATVAPLQDCTGFGTRVLVATLDTGALRVYEFRRGPRGALNGVGPGVCPSSNNNTKIYNVGQCYNGMARPGGFVSSGSKASSIDTFLVRIVHRHNVHEGPRRRQGRRPADPRFVVINIHCA